MITFTAPVRIRSNGTAPASRHFVTIPKDIGETIKKEVYGFISEGRLSRKGRGSVKVQATIAYLKRATSIFPDKKSDSYLLPIKASIRKELHIEEGSEVYVSLELL